MASQTRKTLLGRDDKRTRLFRDLSGELDAGGLAPGARLASTRALAERYGISRRLVLDVLGELVRQGRLERRERSGYFVRVAEEDTEPLPAPARAAPVHGRRLAQARVYEPLRRRSALTLYISDIHPLNRNVWQASLAAFQRCRADVRIQPIFGLHEHPQEVMARTRVDVVQTSPGILWMTGPERFLSLPEPAAIGLQPDDLLAPVRSWLDWPQNPVRAAPFNVTLGYLYENERLASGVAPGSCEELFRRAAAFEAERAGTADASYAFACGRASVELEWNGALRFGTDGRVHLDEERTRATLARRCRQPLALDAEEDMDVPPRLFRDGRLLWFHQGSYLTIGLGDRFPWRARPMPLAEGQASHTDLNVLAVNRETPMLQECLDLVRHLTSPEEQSRFARLHGNLPVLRSALDGAYSDGHPVARDTIETTLARACLIRDQGPAWHDFSHDVDRCGRALSRAELAMDEAWARLRLSFDRYCRRSAEEYTRMGLPRAADAAL